MKLGLRGRLFLVSVALIFAFGSTSAVYLEFELRRWLESRMETELFGQATAARVAVEVDAGARTLGDFDALAGRLGQATNARVTLIASDGRVLGDSAAGVEPGGIGNHRQRPEVVAASAQGRGVLSGLIGR